MLGLEGNGQAVGGPITLHLTTQDGYRVSWNGDLDVVELAKPVLTFIGISDSMGMDIAEIPVGAPGFIAQWQLFNDGVSSWTPELSLDLPDNTWQGVCDPSPELESAVHQPSIASSLHPPSPWQDGNLKSV